MSDPVEVGPIDREMFQKYLALHAEADQLWERISAHGLQVARALSGADVDKATGTNGVMVFYTTRFDEIGSFKVELLFDPDWKKTIQDYLDRRSRAWEERRVREEAEAKRKQEEKDRATLAELAKKYPDALKPAESTSSKSSTDSAPSGSTQSSQA